MKVNIDADTLHLLKEAVTSDDREWIVCVDDGKGQVQTQSSCSPIFMDMCAEDLHKTAKKQMDSMSQDDMNSMLAGFLLKTIDQKIKDKGDDDETN